MARPRRRHRVEGHPGARGRIVDLGAREHARAVRAARHEHEARPRHEGRGVAHPRGGHAARGRPRVRRGVVELRAGLDARPPVVDAAGHEHTVGAVRHAHHGRGRIAPVEGHGAGRGPGVRARVVDLGRGVAEGPDGAEVAARDHHPATGHERVGRPHARRVHAARRRPGVGGGVVDLGRRGIRAARRQQRPVHQADEAELVSRLRHARRGGPGQGARVEDLHPRDRGRPEAEAAVGVGGECARDLEGSICPEEVEAVGRAAGVDVDVVPHVEVPAEPDELAQRCGGHQHLQGNRIGLGMGGHDQPLAGPPLGSQVGAFIALTPTSPVRRSAS